MAAVGSVESISSDKTVPQDKSLRKGILHWKGDFYREWHFHSTGQLYDKVVVGLATFRHFTESSLSKDPSLLLLKRAYHEKHLPGVLEIPGGKVEAKSSTIRRAMVQDMNETTGLDVIDIIAELKPMTYLTQQMVTDDFGQQTSVVQSVIQLNYIVSTTEDDVTVDPNEHSESCWATEVESRKLDMTKNMQVVVEEAFKWASGQQSS